MTDEVKEEIPECGAVHPLLPDFVCNMLVSHMTDPTFPKEHRMYNNEHEFAAWSTDDEMMKRAIGIMTPEEIAKGAERTRQMFENVKNADSPIAKMMAAEGLNFDD